MIRPRLFLTFLIGAALVAPMASATSTTAAAAGRVAGCGSRSVLFFRGQLRAGDLGQLRGG